MTVNEAELNRLSDALFERSLLPDTVIGNTINAMRNSTFAVTMGGLSWLTGMA